MPASAPVGDSPTSASPLASPGVTAVPVYGAITSSQHERVRSLVSQDEANANAHRSPLAHAFFPHQNDLFTDRSAPPSLSRKVQLAINSSLAINIVRVSALWWVFAASLQVEVK